MFLASSGLIFSRYDDWSVVVRVAVLPPQQDYRLYVSVFVIRTSVRIYVLYFAGLVAPDQ